MADLFTLRAASGLPADPPALGASTLTMIDCQNTYTRGPLELAGVQAALDQAEELLDRARSAGIPIIHIQHDAGPGSPYDVREEIGAIVDRVAPRAGEPTIVKNFPNSFTGTELDTMLKQGPERPTAACRVHDAHVRELDRTWCIQPGLRADGDRRRDGHPGPARHRRAHRRGRRIAG